MKKYEKEIQTANDQVTALKAIGKGHSASLVQTKINRLSRAVSLNDEKAAEKAATELTGEVKSIEVAVEDSASKKKELERLAAERYPIYGWNPPDPKTGKASCPEAIQVAQAKRKRYIERMMQL